MAKHSLIRFNVLVGISIMSFVSGCSTTERSQDYTFALSNPERLENERVLDVARKPNEVLAFYGVKRGQKVADIWAVRGYYTAILSQVVGTQGVVYSANPNPRPEFSDRWKKPGYENVKVVDGPFDKLALSEDGSFEFVLIILNFHDLALHVLLHCN